MLQIGMIVKILPDAEYSGKFTGYIGKVKNYFSQNKKVGVELFQQTNDASSKGLFWSRIQGGCGGYSAGCHDGIYQG